MTAYKRVAVIVISILIATIPTPASAERPLIPINTNFSYWDHHWIMWTPQHPTYEAIEAMTFESPGDPSSRLIRVFFTERDGSKKQVHYFNDQAIVKTWRGEAYYRNIECKTDGKPGKPFNLFLKFQDKQSHIVEWTMSFQQDQSLSSQFAGLKDQGGHAAETVFLVFYSGSNATTSTSKLLVGGTDYSSQDQRAGDKKRYYSAAYSSGAYTPVISYTQSTYFLEGTGLRNSWGRRFTKVAGSDSGSIFRSNSFGFRENSVIEVRTNLTGDIHSYDHRYGEHVFQVQFNPPFPALNSRLQTRLVNYSFSLDGFKDLIKGVLSIEKGQGALNLVWQHNSPNWAKHYPFQTVIHPNATGYNLTTTRKKSL
jgi:hypothetical protein